MLQCENCGTPLEEGTRFCPECGTPVPQAQNPFQPTANNPVLWPPSGEATGSPAAPVLQEGVAPPAEEAPAAEQTQPAGKKNPFALFWGKVKSHPVPFIAAAAAVVVLVGGFFVFRAMTAKPEIPVFYIKDKQMNYVLPSQKDSPVEFTDHFDNKTEESYQVRLSKDGKRLFYPDNFSDDSFTLYYRDINKKDSAEKIDSELSYYLLYQNDSLLVYKKQDKSVYLSDLKDKTKVDANVQSFQVSDQGKKMVYLTEDGNLYVRGIGLNDEKEKISGSVEGFDMNKAASKIYFITDKTLYLKEDGQEKKKISSDVDSIVSFDESGNVFFSKDNKKTVTLSDYVNDDMAQSDSAVTMPNQSSYTTFSVFYGYVYQNVDWDSYNKAMDLYYAKESRDTLRENLSKTTVDLESSSLYLYNGSSTSLVADNVAGTTCYSFDLPAVVYTKYSNSTVAKMDISKVKSVNDVQTAVQNSHKKEDSVYLSVNGKETEVNQTKAEEFDIIGGSLYYIDSPAADKSGTLMKISLKDNKAGTPEKIDTGVFQIGYYVDDAKGIVYEKNLSNKTYDVYRSKEKVATNVSESYYDDENDTFYLMTGLSASSNLATLEKWNGGKTEKIADDVYNFYVRKDGSVAFLSNYKNNLGDLMLKSGSGEPQKLADGVSAMAYNDVYRGN